MHCGHLDDLRDLRVMQYEFTPGARRALISAAQWNSRAESDELEPPALLLGLLAEPECRAAIMLSARQIDTQAVQRQWTGLSPRGPADGGVLPPFSLDTELCLAAACERLADYPRPLELATEHLLLGLVAAGCEASAWLRQRGFDPDTLEAEIHRLYGHQPGPLAVESLPMDEEPRLSENTVPSPPPAAKWPQPLSPARNDEGIGTLRILDAAANRAREGLRAVEDYVRFILDDRHLTGLCKQMRHDLAAALRRVPTEHRLSARETRADVGTAVATPSEQFRRDPVAVLAANLARLQEGLRSLEEFGKLLDVDMAAELEQLRYRSYTLQRAVEITRTSLDRLGHARLYVLIDGCPSPEALGNLVRSLVEVGVDVVQLRDKQLDDRRLLQRARMVREWTAGSRTLFVVNDRPDLAALAGADGVHVGQNELSVKDVRTIVGPTTLIGVSTHSIEQARQAVLDGASYIGVGPTFPSGTKRFEQFPGVALLRAVAAEIRLPAFAIGGVAQENVSEVLSTGIGRIAVSGAITSAADPVSAARDLLDVLKSS